MTDRNIAKKKKSSEVKTFPVPFSLEEIKENITITSNTPSKHSKEEIIKQAFIFHSEGNILEATKYYQLFINQGFIDHRVFSNYGVILKNTGKLEEAELLLRKAIELNPNFADAHSNLGMTFNMLGKQKEAELSLRKAIELNPNFADSHYNLGIILNDLGKPQEAELSLRKATELNPDFAEAYSNLGNILRDLDKLKEAELSYLKAIELKPDLATAHSNLGNILKDLGKSKEAEISLLTAIKLKPDYANAYCNLGNILRDLGKLKEAELSTRKAIEINPDHAEAHYNLGMILNDLGQLTEAELSTRKAIEIKPDYAEAHSNLGTILQEFGKYDDAINCYKKAIKLNEKLSVAISGLIECKGIICDWSDQELQTKWLENLGIEGSSVPPFGLLHYEDTPLKHLKRSKIYYKERYYQQENLIPLSNNKKIHIGYFSADFNNHPVMLLLASVLELHDKSKFKVFLYSFVQKEDEYTERARKSGCVFRDIKNLNHKESIELARHDQIDIAVDLMGYTKNHRISLFSSRIAPIQINYLGYPGSLGVDAIDYIIGDSIVIPKGHEKYYTEKVIRMPNCYLCTDDKMKISKETFSRKDFNLPEEGFIFTCFNGLKKITPSEFDIWMRLLSKTKGSVLWLKGSNRLAINNLRLEAEKKNIDKNRLIFADNLPLDKHLARHSIASLGLDTFAFNGCTTSTFGLWAGMPILTKIGESFAARFTASLLNSMEVNELITHSKDEYEEVALRLANDPNELLELKYKIRQSINTSPLFNSELFTRDLETKYIELVNSISS